MKNLLRKEIRLASSPLSWFFIASALLAFAPGYPILVGSFFVCLGLFQSFQAARESNDLAYTALLPVAKSDIPKARLAFCVLVELCFFALTSAAALVRMAFLSDLPAYRSNVLMNANLVYLGYVLLVLGLFNLIFVGGFFKTGCKIAGPFVAFSAAAFLVVCVGETLFHIPPLSALNAFGFSHIALQTGALLGGMAAYGLLTAASVRRSIRNFERVDL